jgi:hypothetical protein
VASTPGAGIVVTRTLALLHDGLDALPFFSKVALTSLRASNRQLRRMRYRISIAWVGTEPA